MGTHPEVSRFCSSYRDGDTGQSAFGLLTTSRLPTCEATVWNTRKLGRYPSPLRRTVDPIEAADSPVRRASADATARSAAHLHASTKGAEIRFLRGCIKFGEAKNSARFANLLIVYRGDTRP